MPALGLALSVLIGVSLGFFGGGGSILTVPLLVYVFGLPPKQAIASSLVIVGIASLTGAFQHWRAGRVDLRAGLFFGSAGMAGAYLGGRAAAFVDGALLLLLFACMMALTSLAMWRGRRAPPAAAAPLEPAPGRLVAQGFSVGLFTGLIGAGGGFLIVPALALWAGLPMLAAVGTSLFVIVMNTAAGFLGTLAHVRVDWALVGAISAAAVAGSLLGTRLARRVDPASLRRAFALFVLGMAVLVLVREARIWLETVQGALPASLPQMVFVIVVLAAGIAAGRVSRAPGGDPLERPYEQGAGI